MHQSVSVGMLCAVCERTEAGLDLVESTISPSDWETRSWLDYSFKREIVSIPSSLNSSWVVLNTNSEPFSNPTTPPTSPERQMSCSMEHESYDGNPMELATTHSPADQALTSGLRNTITHSSQVTSTPKLDGSLTLAELGEEVMVCIPSFREL